ncbi:MAG: ion transporter [Caldilineaceae bacterium]
MSPKSELKAIGYELFIGALSVLSILNLFLLFIYNGSQEIENVLLVMNTILTPIFLGDFVYRLLTAESRSTYFWRGFGWADLLSSLPFARAKFLRFFRLWRVIRLFVKFGLRNLVRQFVTHRAENALLTVVFLVICVLQFGALSVLYVEINAPNGNIKNASDALWWVYVSITTVGYGDRFPTTDTGRIIGLFVLTAGVGLFGTLSGYLANAFLTQPKADEAGQMQEETGRTEAAARAEGTEGETAQPAPSNGDARQQIAALRQLLASQEATAAELRYKLDEFERMLT